MEIDGRVALVTGAGTRVGRVIALALGRAGMRVGVHYAGSEKGARETAEEIIGMGSDARTMPGDLTDPATGPRLVEHTHKVFGSFDVLVNSAAVMLRTPVGEVLVEDWDAMFALNLRAPFFLCQAAARAMRDTGGAIVNIADLAAFETWRDATPSDRQKVLLKIADALESRSREFVEVESKDPGKHSRPRSGLTRSRRDPCFCRTVGLRIKPTNSKPRPRLVALAARTTWRRQYSICSARITSPARPSSSTGVVTSAINAAQRGAGRPAGRVIFRRWLKYATTMSSSLVRARRE